MSNLSPIKLPQPDEPQDNESERREKEEEDKLRGELLHLVSSGGFKYSRRVIEKANLESLRDIRMIYDQVRARHLVKTIISYLAVIIARGLYKVDCVGEHQVEPLIESVTEDQLFEQDMVWLLGKLVNKVPCPGLVSVGGKVGMEVAKHKWGKQLKKVEEGVTSFAKEVKGDMAGRRTKLVVKRANSLSSISSLSSEDES